jgi:hypothetical protein
LTEGAIPAEIIICRPAYGSENETLLYFPKELEMAIMSCISVIENMTASATVARGSAQVLEFE